MRLNFDDGSWLECYDPPGPVSVGPQLDGPGLSGLETTLLRAARHLRNYEDPAREPARALLLGSATYWLDAARVESYTMGERLLFMENALNHVHNALCHVVEGGDDGYTEGLRLRLLEMRAKR